MANFKRIAAAALAASLACSLAACGKNSMTAFTVDGEEIKAGVYIYYSYVAYNDAITTLQEQNPDLDTTDDSVVKDQTIDGKDTLTWIKDKAAKYCKEQIAVNKQYEEAGLTLSEESKAEVAAYMEQVWGEQSEKFERNGISEASVHDVIEYTYKASDLFSHYYNIDGVEGVTEKEVHEYYVDNTARVQYIAFNAVDGNGEALKGNAEKDFKKMVDDYLASVEKLNDEKKIEEKMNSIQEEYTAYVTSVSEEAAAEAAATATDENGETVGTTTTTTTTLSEEEESTTTTTTTVPYANESVIARVTTDEKTKEEDLTYRPNKTVYDFIYNEAKQNKPEVVYDEESNTYYLVVRYDLEKRMTDDDLWTDTIKEGVVSVMFSDEFQTKLDEWVAALNVTVNDAAIDRYDPFEINFDDESTTTA